MKRLGINIVFLAVAALVLTTGVSCVLDVDFDRLKDSPLCGRWQSDIEYSGVSDDKYDYGNQVTLEISVSGNASMTIGNFLKLRAGSEWSENLSKTPTSTNYSVWIYPQGSDKTRGSIDFADPKTLDPIMTLKYSLSVDGKLLVLSDNGYTQRIYKLIQ